MSNAVQFLWDLCLIIALSTALVIMILFISGGVLLGVKDGWFVLKELWRRRDE